MPENIAILDIGSNSARISVFAAEKGSAIFLTRKKETCRLSSGMAQDGFLTKESMERTCLSIINLLSLAKQYDCKTIVTAATAAVRNAHNKDEFLQLIKEKTNLSLRVLSGEEEALAGFLGVKTSLSLSDFILIDTGGGSAEISLIKDNALIESISLPIGAVVMTDLFLGHNVIDGDDFFRLLAHISDEINKMSVLNTAMHFPIIALGGPNKTLAKIEKKSKDIHGFTMTQKTVFAVFSDLLSKTLPERELMLGDEKDRADVIIAGLAPLLVLMQRLDSASVTICDHGLEYGLLYEYRKEKNLLSPEEIVF